MKNSKNARMFKWVPKKKCLNSRGNEKGVPKALAHQEGKMEGKHDNPFIIDQGEHQRATRAAEGALQALMEVAPPKATKKGSPMTQTICLGLQRTEPERAVSLEQRVQGKVNSILHIIISLIPLFRLHVGL
jgi:hypothetical protein